MTFASMIEGKSAVPESAGAAKQYCQQSPCLESEQKILRPWSLTDAEKMLQFQPEM